MALEGFIENGVFVFVQHIHFNLQVRNKERIPLVYEGNIIIQHLHIDAQQAFLAIRAKGWKNLRGVKRKSHTT